MISNFFENMVFEEMIVNLTWAQVMQKYGNVRLATPEDNENILAFMQSISMKTTEYEVRYSRTPSFFSLHKLQGTEVLTFLFFGKSGVIQGIASLVFRLSYVRGIEQVVGYLQDLRMSPNAERRVLDSFFKFYADTVRMAPYTSELHNCNFFYTAIISGNIKALKVFSRSSFHFNYNKLTQYKTYFWPVNHLMALGRFVGRKNNLNKSWFFSQGTDADTQELKEFLHLQNKSRLFGYNFSEATGKPFSVASEKPEAQNFSLKYADTWEQMCAARPQFGAHDFIICRNADKKIIACVALLEASSERKLELSQPSKSMQMQIKLLNLISSRNFAPNKALNTLYLSFLEIDRNASPQDRTILARNLVAYTFRNPKVVKYDFLSYLHFDDDFIFEKPFLVPCIISEGSLFRVYHDDHVTLPRFVDGFLRPGESPALDALLA